MKQMGLGIMQYTQDYDELMPLARTSDNRPWQLLIQPYVKSTQLFKCPSNTATGFLNGTGNTIPASYLAVGGPADNQPTKWGGTTAIPPYNGSNPAKATSLASFDTPATTLAVGEHISRTDPEFWVDDANAFEFQNHLGTTNFLFADGHVKAMKPIQTMNPNMWTVEDDLDTLPIAAKNKIVNYQNSKMN